jgi:hypothetical protein
MLCVCVINLIAFHHVINSNEPRTGVESVVYVMYKSPLILYYDGFQLSPLLFIASIVM